MDTEPVNVAERPRDTVACHCPEEGMQSARLLAKEVISSVVRSSSLWYFIGWLWLDGMDEIWEQDSILDEEYGNVVSNEICRSQLHVLLWTR